MAIINQRSECRNHFDLFLFKIMNIKIFENEKFGSIRTNDDANNPMFCLADVCKVLNLENVSRVKSRLSEKGVTLSDALTNGGKQQLTFIDEKNLYRVIMRSDKAEAIYFQDWVCDEVLPSIRKHGMYATDELVNNPDLLIQVATKLKEERAARQLAESKAQMLEQVTLEQAPKVEFYNAVTDSKDCIDMASAAKVLNMGVGRNKLFEILRNNKILMGNNSPFQKYVDAGYFKQIEVKFTKPNGDTCINIKTVVYQKGLDAIRRLLTKLQERQNKL